MALTYCYDDGYLSELFSVLQTPFSGEVKISVIADPHYFDPFLDTSGDADRFGDAGRIRRNI